MKNEEMHLVSSLSQLLNQTHNFVSVHIIKSVIMSWWNGDKIFWITYKIEGEKSLEFDIPSK